MTSALAAACAIAAFSCGYWAWAAFALRRRGFQPHPSAPPTPRPPVTIFRPMKPGVPRAAEILRETAAALASGDQALIGVSDPDTAQLASSVPGLETVRCTPDLCPNPKISKLIQMTPHARNDDWWIVDSEARIAGPALAALAAESGCGHPMTAAYRFAPPTTWAESFDRASTLLTLWPGLAAAPPGLMLGAAMRVSRTQIEAVGGWASFADHLAEDHELGRRLAAAGHAPVLAKAVVLLDGDPVSWREAVAHQIRIAATYRAVAPAGYAGMILVCGLSCSTLAALFAGGFWWLLPAATFAVRLATARHIASTAGFPKNNLAAAIAIHALAEIPLWLAGWLTTRITWAGKRYRIRAGRIAPLRVNARRSASQRSDRASPPAPATGNSVASPARPQADPSPDTAALD